MWDTFTLEINRKVMRDRATLSHCRTFFLYGHHLSVHILVSVFLVSLLSPLFSSIKRQWWREKERWKEGQEKNSPMSALLFSSNNNDNSIGGHFLWRPNVHFLPLWNSRRWLGAINQRRKTLFSCLLVWIQNNDKRKDGGEKERAMSWCPSSQRVYTNVLFRTSTMAPECESWMLLMETVVHRFSQGGDEEENERTQSSFQL